MKFRKISQATGYRDRETGMTRSCFDSAIRQNLGPATSEEDFIGPPGNEFCPICLVHR